MSDRWIRIKEVSMMASRLGKMLIVGGVCAALIGSMFTVALSQTGTEKTGTAKKVKTTKSAVAHDTTMPKPDDFVAIETNPVPLAPPSPVYPDSARVAGIEGKVWVKVLVDKEGMVKDAIVLKDSGTKIGFEEAALAAVRQQTWKPATQKGQPVAVWVSYEIKFSLKVADTEKGSE
jgi:protein TonB